MKCSKIFKDEKPGVGLSGKPDNDQKYEYQKIQALDNFQAIRYGFYRKSDFKKEKIKRIVVNFNPFLKNINSSDPLIIAIKSLTKSFIGELVEFSKKLMHQFEESVDWRETSINKKIIFQALELCLFKHQHFRIKGK